MNLKAILHGWFTVHATLGEVGDSKKPMGRVGGLLTLASRG